MDRVLPHKRGHYESNVQTADTGIINGQVETTSKARKIVWKEWTAYCQDIRVTPYLDGCNFYTVVRVRIMVGEKIRKGKRGWAVSAGSVRAGIEGVNTTITLDTGCQPLH